MISAQYMDDVIIEVSAEHADYEQWFDAYGFLNVRKKR